MGRSFRTCPNSCAATIEVGGLREAWNAGAAVVIGITEQHMELRGWTARWLHVDLDRAVR